MSGCCRIHKQTYSGAAITTPAKTSSAILSGSILPQALCNTVKFYLARNKLDCNTVKFYPAKNKLYCNTVRFYPAINKLDCNTVRFYPAKKQALPPFCANALQVKFLHSPPTCNPGGVDFILHEGHPIRIRPQSALFCAVHIEMDASPGHLHIFPPSAVGHDVWPDGPEHEIRSAPCKWQVAH